MVDYSIMHQFPNPERSFARVKFGEDEEVELEKFEKGIEDEEDVIMFYNAFSPPTSFKIDENLNSIDEPVIVSKLVYGHYCSTDNVNQLLAIDSDILRGNTSLVLVIYIKKCT